MRGNMKTIRNLLQGIFIDKKSEYANGKEIYYIAESSNVGGFFGLLRSVLISCCYADENGFLPYIKYEKTVLYAEKGIFGGTNNPFEYYFRQPTEEICVWKGLNVVKRKPEHLHGIELKYNLNPVISYQIEEDYVNRMAQIYHKYIRLNGRTEKIIEASVRNLLKGKKTLGVHIRGTDFMKEFNGHPVPVTVEEYIEVIRAEALTKSYDQIFVATDDIRCLKEIKKKLPIPLVYYKNVMRGESDKSVAFERNDRKHNNYCLGMEVLKDACTLAACDGFIGCLSQVDIFVRIIKKSRGQEFDFLKIIDKGVFHNEKRCWEPSK